MTYRTHKEFAIGFVLLANMLFYTFNITDTNYFVCMIVMYLAGRQGALFPDVDHFWKNVKEKTPVNWVINKIIHITGGKHRSRHTHSWDICLVSWLVAIYLNNKYLTGNSQAMMFILILGFWCGWISHLISDMLTSDGVYLFCWRKKRTAIVPKQASRIKLILVSLIVALLGVVGYLLTIIQVTIACGIVALMLLLMALKLGNIRFNTGKEWEYSVFKVIQIFNVVALIIALIYPFIYNYIK